MLMTEMQVMLMRPVKDTNLQKAYTESFIVLTKHFWENPANHEFLTFTFNELLKRFLGGRCESIKLALFQSVFEACPCLGWSMVKLILKCCMIKSTDEAVEGAEKEGARSNH